MIEHIAETFNLPDVDDVVANLKDIATEILQLVCGIASGEQFLVVFLHETCAPTVGDNNMGFGAQDVHHLSAKLDGVVFIAFHQESSPAACQLVIILAMKSDILQNLAHAVGAARLEHVHLTRYEDVDNIFGFLAHGRRIRNHIWNHRSWNIPGNPL